MARLAVNVDHVATVRQARGIDEPDPVLAAGLGELAGAEGIICHLREDRRHINDRDLQVLRRTVKTKLNMEMAGVDEMVDIALAVQPDLVTLVPERREELTTEGGLDVEANPDRYARVSEKLHRAGIEVSFFVDPLEFQIRSSRQCGRWASARGMVSTTSMSSGSAGCRRWKNTASVTASWPGR
jgi:pyridoxine 5-phosphate synthase